MKRDDGRWVVTPRDRQQFVASLVTCTWAKNRGDCRACRAVRMRGDGLSWAFIATRLGYWTPRTARLAAWRHVRREAE